MLYWVILVGLELRERLLAIGYQKKTVTRGLGIYICIINEYERNVKKPVALHELTHTN